EEALKIAKESKTKTEQIFNHENYPVPQGFTDKDVNFNAPRLFSDKIYLHYILNITNLNTTADTTAITMAARSDIIDFYSNKLKLELQLHKKAIELDKQQGTYIRTPIIPKPDKIEFVEKESILTGWLGKQRTLLGTEIEKVGYAQ